MKSDTTWWKNISNFHLLVTWSVFLKIPAQTAQRSFHLNRYLRSLFKNEFNIPNIIFLVKLNATIQFQLFFLLINNLIMYSVHSKLATFGELGNNL